MWGGKIPEGGRCSSAVGRQGLSEKLRTTFLELYLVKPLRFLETYSSRLFKKVGYQYENICIFLTPKTNLLAQEEKNIGLELGCLDFSSNIYNPWDFK